MIGLLLVAAILVAVYAYYTTPLPFGLSSVIETPGGVSAPSPTSITQTGSSGPLMLGAASVAVQSIQRNQDLTANGRNGPVGSFTVVEIVLQNGGSQPIVPQLSDFRLVDDRGRVYAVDPEATRSVNSTARHRVVFDASVPPASSLDTLLAFETPADVSPQSLRVTLGYGELPLPR
jgi:uncharacterized protein DUF4352